MHRLSPGFCWEEKEKIAPDLGKYLTSELYTFVYKVLKTFQLRPLPGNATEPRGCDNNNNKRIAEMGQTPIPEMEYF